MKPAGNRKIKLTLPETKQLMFTSSTVSFKGCKVRVGALA
jgi:hypothetical protein